MLSSDEKEAFLVQRLLLFRKHRYEKLHIAITSCLKLGASNYRGMLYWPLSPFRAYVEDLPIILLRNLFSLSAV